MLKPLEQFICDKCQGVIKEPKYGVIEWRKTENLIAYDYKIVHHPTAFGEGSRGCYFYRHESKAGWLHLDRVLGAEGLIILLFHVDRTRDDTKGLADWAEIARRLNVPYFEEARRYWQKARADGFISERSEWLYSPDTSKEIILKYGAVLA